MASSEAGRGMTSALDRTKRSRSCGTGTPGSSGFQIVAGVSVSFIETLRGPVLRSRYGASDVRHDSAACCRSAGVIVTCINFSASANVSGVTGGPEPGPVPNVGGAPGVAGVCEGVCELPLLIPAAITSMVSGARIRKSRRVFIGLSVKMLPRVCWSIIPTADQVVCANLCALVVTWANVLVRAKRISYE